MPTPTADIVLVRTQVLEKLLASPKAARYTDAIGTNSEFSVLQELTDNILLADEIICGDIIATAGHGWRQQFMGWSSNLQSGNKIPKFIGAPGAVKTKVGSADFTFSQLAKDRDEVLAMIRHPTLYESKNFHWIEDGLIYTPADYAQVQFPSFTREATCQSPQIAEPALIFGGISLSEKTDNDNPFFRKYDALFQAAREFVRTGQIIPPQTQLEKMIEQQ